MDNALTNTTRCLTDLRRCNVRFAFIALGWILVLRGGTLIAQRAGLPGGQANPVVTNACIQPPASVAHWWTGDGSALDLPGGSHGTSRGRVAFDSGKVAEAFSFDGTNGVIEASVAFNRVDGWALAAWVYWKGPSQDAAQKGEAIFYQGDPGKDGYGLFIIGSGFCSDFPELCFRAGELGILYGGVHWYFPELRLQQNTWIHLGLARSGGFMNVYFNGVLAWSRPGLSPIAPTATFAISREQPFTFNGLIDEVTLFSSPMDSGELGSIARAGSAGMCKAPAFTAISQPRGGFIEFTTQGKRSNDVTVLSSPDLTKWQSILRLPNPTGTLTFSMPVDRGLGQKFYRLLSGN